MGIPGDSDLSADPEAKLIEGCKNGSMAAYEQLYRSQGARMKSVAQNFLGNAPDAEDAVQEAFLKIFRNVRRFKGDSAFTTWIFRILVNCCYDLARKRRRRQPEVQETLLEPGTLEMLSASAGDHPLRLTLERSLARLSARNRAVFLLFEVEGFKHREIADILNIREGTSKNLLFEAKKELQRLLWQPPTAVRTIHETEM